MGVMGITATKATQLPSFSVTRGCYLILCHIHSPNKGTDSCSC